MKIGYSSIDITPEPGVELSGYGWFLERKAEGVLDNLYARAVAFEGDNKRMLLINCDLVAIDKPISDAVKQQISNEISISKTNIMIVCTHTHTGPATGRLIGCGEPDEKYRSVLIDLLIGAGKSAFNNLMEIASVKSVTKEIEPIGFNRVSKDGPVDNVVRGMVFYFDEGRPLAILSYGCHPVTLGPLRHVSADYPGRVIKALNEEGFDGVFLTGLCGDIDPVQNLIKWGSGTPEIIDEYGRRIVNVLLDSVSKTEEMKESSLDAYEIDLSLKLQKYKHEDIDRQVEIYERKKEENPGAYKVAKIWAAEMKTQLERSKEPYLEFLTVQIFRIGNVLLIGFPGEVFTEIGSIIRESLPDFNVLALGNANSTMRYVPTRDDIEKQGYAGLLSCLLYLRLPLEPGEGERMAEIVAGQIR
ncbi:MAG TPA: neutral/alkaline non-lysosomal ceramidase N-terminal domain-containing protein [Clostridiales bacterium]|nr:neutral/alkaline non-lysosomal ceramidase N-terminal domain-containing protein [Clostridiales bacterium]